nr:unnamed protein product [Callosobruchus chinensis]
MNTWSNEETACVVTSMLRHRATAILENLSSSDLPDYGTVTSALKLRFGDEHLTVLLHGQLQYWTQQTKEDLITLAYEVLNEHSSTVPLRYLALELNRMFWSRL